MDPAFIEREKELFKLNAKLNSKAKKIASTISQKSSVKPVQIHTANSHFNYYDDSLPPQKESQDEGLELSCKKINISNQPPKKNHEIVYPLFNRRNVKDQTTSDIHIHIPSVPGSLIDADGIEESAAKISVDLNSEAKNSQSLQNESLVTCFSDDSFAVAPTGSIKNPLTPPRTIEKKNISNDGLLKYFTQIYILQKPVLISILSFLPLFSRFLKSKVALLQTELEAGKNLNDTIEKENAKHLKKIKKLSSQVDKLTEYKTSMESTLTSLKQKQESCEQNMRVNNNRFFCFLIYCI